MHESSPQSWHFDDDTPAFHQYQAEEIGQDHPLHVYTTPINFNWVLTGVLTRHTIFNWVMLCTLLRPAFHRMLHIELEQVIIRATVDLAHTRASVQLFARALFPYIKSEHT